VLLIFKNTARTAFSFLSSFAIKMASPIFRELRYVRNFRKWAVSFVMAVCSSVCPFLSMEQSGSHKTDFREVVFGDCH
jgi:hypothetical protein